ncbi:TPA: hypothetical protein DDW35_06225 [Candidatus Sumerlaeota bacterium]|jgi:ABC-2 type transport system permease protein|nr:hypothetical protein [Candidatus Sumerlaeota bacterium]
MTSVLTGFVPVFKRETAQYFKSPGMYVALAFFLLLSGAMFTGILGDFSDLCLQVTKGDKTITDTDAPLNLTVRVVSELFGLFNFLLLLLAPMLTMRLVAEEKRAGSLELLVSTPLQTIDILLGKFFAALFVGFLTILALATYPAILYLCKGHPELSVVLSSYIGLFLLMAAYTAFGLFASCLTDSQITAGVVSFAGLLLLLVLNVLVKQGAIGSVAAALSISRHSEAFTKGVVSITDAVYFVLFVVFFLFLSVQALDARKYKG